MFSNLQAISQQVLRVINQDQDSTTHQSGRTYLIIFRTLHLLDHLLYPVLLNTKVSSVNATRASTILSNPSV